MTRRPCVLAWFVNRVCVLGAESTGTTTLCQDVASHCGCDWVPEYGRQFCAARSGDIDWSTTDFEHIARRQLSDEAAAAREAARAGSRLLVCDTDALATAVWHERYLGTRSAAVERMAARRSYALYIPTGDDILFVQDGTSMTSDHRLGLGHTHADLARPTRWRGLNLLGFALNDVRDRL